MAQRHLAAAAHAELATAWRRLVLHTGKGDALAAHLAVPASRVTEWSQPDSGRAPSVTAVLEAEAFAGRPFVTEALATAQGFRLVPVEAEDATDLEPLAADVAAEFGQAFAVLAAALRDGKVTPAELVKLAREFGDVERAAGRVRRAAAGRRKA